jgi:hypothetical protein
MATSPVPVWAQEMSPTHTGPTAGGILQLAVLVLVLVLAFQWFAAADSGAAQVDRKAGVSSCDEHRGQPAWDRICAETARRHRR